MEYTMLDVPSLHEANEQMVVSNRIPNSTQKGKRRSNNSLPCAVWRKLDHSYALPFVRRGTLVLTANYLIKKIIIAEFQTVLSNEILSCIPYEKFQMTNCEAKAFTNIFDKSPIERHVFQPGEYLVNLVSVKALIQFLVTCHDLIINQIRENSLFGFVRINDKNQVPFIWNDGKKLVPLFYFDGQSEFLDARSIDLVDSWKIWYIQFCCKLQKIRKEFHEQYPLKVVDLDDVKSLFPAETSFELCCPEHINQDFLAPEVRVAALYNTTPCSTSTESDAQTSVISNKAIEISKKGVHTVPTANLQLKDASLCSKSSDTGPLSRSTAQAEKRRVQTPSVAKAKHPTKKGKSTKLKEFKKKCTSLYLSLYPSAKNRRKNNTVVTSQERDPQINTPTLPSTQHNGQQLISQRLVKDNITNTEQTEATLRYEICHTSDLGQRQHQINIKPTQIHKNENDVVTDKVIENVQKTFKTELEKYVEHMRTEEERRKLQSAKCSLQKKKVVTNCSPNTYQVNPQPLNQNKKPIEGHYIPTTVSQCVSSSDTSHPIGNTNKAVQKRKNILIPVLVEESNMGVKRKMKAHATNTSETDENSLNTNLSQKYVERRNQTAVKEVKQIMDKNCRESSLLKQSKSPKSVASSTPVIQTNSLRQSVQTSSNVYPLVVQKLRTLTPEVTISSVRSPGTGLNQNKCITNERLKPVVNTTPISIKSQNTITDNLPTRSIIKCHKTNPSHKSPEVTSPPGRPQPGVFLKNGINTKRDTSLTANVKQKMEVPSDDDDLEWFQEEPRGNNKRIKSIKKNYTAQRMIAKKQKTPPRCKSIASPDDRLTSYLPKIPSPQLSPFDISTSHSYPGLVHLYTVAPVVNPHDLGPQDGVDNIKRNRIQPLKRNHIQPKVLSPMQLEILRLEMQQYLNHQYQRLVYRQGFIDGRLQTMQNASRIKKNK